jgi:hypothetical protein
MGSFCVGPVAGLFVPGNADWFIATSAAAKTRNGFQLLATKKTSHKTISLLQTVLTDAS